jgi:hypothetical protein
MRENPVWCLTVSPRCFPHSVILLFWCAVLVLGGCSIRRRPDIPWAIAVQVRPVTLQQTAETNDVSEDPIPELRFELPASSVRLIPARIAPPRPRGSAAPTATTGNDAEKAEAPTIAPQLTPQEFVAAQLQTNESLATAERNLGAARGKTLSAVQRDLVSKIQGFIKDAREAAQITDWSRARSLAKKAQVLSEELASSL